MAFDELTAACIREVAEMEHALEHTRQWNAARWERLSKWAREELPEPLKVRFFNIVANGTTDPMEPPTLTQQYNQMKHRAESAEAELVRLRSRVALPAVIEQIAQQWDGCTYEAPGECIDIGQAVRDAARRIAGVAYR